MFYHSIKRKVQLYMANFAYGIVILKSICLSVSNFGFEFFCSER